MGLYDPFTIDDFIVADTALITPYRAAAIANAKFGILITNWVPANLMAMVEVDKNALEARLRELEAELNRFKKMLFIDD